MQRALEKAEEAQPHYDWDVGWQLTYKGLTNPRIHFTTNIVT